MRLVPQSIIDAWYDGDFTGDRRNFARVTVQQGNTRLYQLPYNLYASSVFGSPFAPVELPNVKSVKWSRSTDQDFASATIEFYNTAPMPLGTVPSRDLDSPGYYTFNRGKTQFSSRWGHKQNRFTGLLMPDNILRSYEGYGFDPNEIPEKDTHLVSTGVWRIDRVVYSANGIVTCTCRDVGSILADELIFPPVVPKNYWPVTFTANPDDQVGFVGPSADSETIDTANVVQPDGWDGPVDGPDTTSTDVGSRSITVNWTRPTTGDSPGGDTSYGYKVVGYQIAVDGVILPKVYRAGRTSATVKGVHGIHNGNVYSIRVTALWQEQLTAKGELHFKSRVVHTARSNFGPESIARPQGTNAGLPVVTPGSIEINVNEASELAPNYVTFGYDGDGKYIVVAYKTGDTKQHSFAVDAVGAGMTHVDTGGVLGDMTEWNFLVYGRLSTDVEDLGPGDVFFRGIGGGWYGAPEPGRTPTKAPNEPTPKVKHRRGKLVVKTALKKKRLHLHYNDSSNTPYYGRGPDVDVYGHDPDDAFNDNPSYWLSVGNDSPARGFAYEWIEGKLNGATLSSVQLKTVGKHYGVYLSVFSEGRWVQHSDTGVIPYNPDLPESHNHANIPYAEYHNMGDHDDMTITLRRPIPKATRIRLTFHNLQYFGAGTYHYRAAVRHIHAHGITERSTKKRLKPPPSPKSLREKPVVGGVKARETSETTYTPAHVVPGLGANPGLYEDYTDIIKLLCAWGGFFWSLDAQQILSDGSIRTYTFGAGPYGLPNVDPVLGDIDGGRIWGDLEDTGTAGIAQLPVNVFTQKALMDGISYVRDIVGYIFYVDEDGAVVWRRPNWYAIGNWIGNDAPAGTPIRVTNCIELDERTVLTDLQAALDGKNVRERIFVATTDGQTGALAAGYNPNPTGLRRVGGWTDQNFSSIEECQVMADLIALRGLFTYHQDTLTIPAYPAIQVDDQVIPIERMTGEGYYHYVSGIDSSNDLEAGGWTYDLTTNWLGDDPFKDWAFDPAELSAETQTYLDAYDFGEITTLPAGKA